MYEPERKILRPGSSKLRTGSLKFTLLTKLRTGSLKGRTKAEKDEPGRCEPSIRIGSYLGSLFLRSVRQIFLSVYTQFRVAIQIKICIQLFIF